jgi:hypothetical protein
MNYHEMLVKDICALPGVSELPVHARGKLAQALRTEFRGDLAHASELLEAALMAEAAADGVLAGA